MISEQGFDQVLAAAQELDPELQHAPVNLIQLAPWYLSEDEAVFVDENLREAGAFEVSSPLIDRHPRGAPVLEADLLAAMDSMVTEWEDDSAI
jgi:hypothetical protein